MPFWNRKHSPKEFTAACDTGKVQKAKAPVKRTHSSPLEIKLLAIEALETDLTTKQVAEIVGKAALLRHIFIYSSILLRAS